MHYITQHFGMIRYKYIFLILIIYLENMEVKVEPLLISMEESSWFNEPAAVCLITKEELEDEEEKIAR
jgi:hypothetical protein